VPNQTDPFQDIRPYFDHEVPEAICRLLDDADFLHAILNYRLAAWPKTIRYLFTPVLRWLLARKAKGLRSVSDVQHMVADFLQQSLQKSSAGVSVSGLEHLDPKQSYLFVSNHRDIAMDPALVNWCLHQKGMDTVRIAIGDNLLKMPCATELMKLNKSFIVKRSIKAPREMLKALGQLSAYIKDSLETGHSIWIAQKEGRAKDGLDQTDEAILKMFYIEGKKRGLDFATYMQSLHIVPVCLSYEFDPLDQAKANELYQLACTGEYKKSEMEDIQSIVQGIVGQKGRVHVHFGEAIQACCQDPAALAAEVDRQIWAGYRLYPVNYLAAGMDIELEPGEEGLWYQTKMASLPEELRPYVQQMYAAPALKQQQTLAQQELQASQHKEPEDGTAYQL
jgi:1-acyl-sn-glycerol-3-phosphate acyltransferase